MEQMIVIASKTVCMLVALERLGFKVLEMVFWRRPLGLKLFRRTAAEASSSAGLAANQGLYNGLLAGPPGYSR